MSIERHNAEHYLDPTAYAALTAIEREEQSPPSPFRPPVYICSPFAGNTERNLENARRYCRFAVERGAIPFASHLLYPQFMDDRNTEHRALGLLFCRVWLAKCHEIWVFGSVISDGMRMELDHARKKGIPVRFFTTDCEVLTP